MEISIPGGTQVYALDGNSDAHQDIVGTSEWNNVFVSSVLRSLEVPNIPTPILRVLRELKTHESF